MQLAKHMEMTTNHGKLSEALNLFEQTAARYKGAEHDMVMDKANISEQSKYLVEHYMDYLRGIGEANWLKIFE